MQALLGALLIFTLRIGDVSVGTLRVMYMVRGHRFKAVSLGLVESFIWVVAIAQVMEGIKEGPLNMIAFAAGFAAGQWVGITIEQWIASGWILVRIISRQRSEALSDRIRQEHFGVTTLRGEGREGEILILSIVAPRKRSRELLDLARATDPDAFITVDSITHAIGGYVPLVAESASVKK